MTGTIVFGSVLAQLAILAFNLRLGFRSRRHAKANTALLREMEVMRAALEAFHAKIQADIDEHGAILLPAPAGPTPICLN